MTQLIQPDLTVVAPAGMCLNYAQKVYHVPHKYDSAWANWEASPTKHTDAIPTDVAVPCWFSYSARIAGIYKNWGHVVVSVPGKGFYSSPYADRIGFDVLKSIAEIERKYSIGGTVKYVGWTEDIADVKVVEGDDMKANKTILTKLWVGYGMGTYPAADSYLNHWDGSEMGVDGDVLDWLEKQPAHVNLLNKSADYDRVLGVAEDRLKTIHTVAKEKKELQDQMAKEGTKLKPGKYIV